MPRAAHGVGILSRSVMAAVITTAFRQVARSKASSLNNKEPLQIFVVMIVGWTRHTSKMYQ